jgi:hypothetical protein
MVQVPKALQREVLTLYTQMRVTKYIRTRRLAVRMLHTYRPYRGRMFLKSMQAALD